LLRHLPYYRACKYLGQALSVGRGPSAPAGLDSHRPSKEFAAGDLISTTADLNRFFDALLSGKLTSQRSLAAMRDVVNSTLPGQRYGLGLMETRLPCGKSVWGHDGGMAGFITYSMRADDGRQVTISANPYTQQPPPDAQATLFSKIFCET
jgi:D-alanyl-D-alanine carboxypeptidase